ncbi:50S ribosomal protein L23 [Candidatus Micrarchaeota archaeon]|nr:50S ribosomal protein L23 [Candidatus Micrarchaeota archaeon]
MIFISPLKTEKAIMKIEKENTLTFVVDMSATKATIKSEAEKLFSVKVAGVQIMIGPNGKKYAFVRLEKAFKADDVATKLKMVA